MQSQVLKVFNRGNAFRFMKWRIRILGRIPFARAIIRLGKKRRAEYARELLNLKFENPIGLGPGLDKDGTLYNTLYDFGFSFIEIGPVNSSNVLTVIGNLQKTPADPFIALCINKDHTRSFSLAYDFADFFDFEIPDNQIESVLDSILDIRLTYDTYKPVLLKLSLDFTQSELERIINFCLLNGVDGVIVAKTDLVRRVNDIVKNHIPIIGYGGIRTPEMAREMIEAGADLIEITTGLVLDGPRIAGKILKHL